MNSDIERKRPELRALCVRHGVRRLDLFGSAAREGFDPSSSDYDFLVEFEPMPPARHAEAYFALEEGLSGIFGRTVDVVELGAIQNPFFKKVVEASRVLLYEAAA
jgi:predicted nucleotidyltransferase